jgi:DNA-binding MarR family transcriptional regulator
MNEVNVDQPQSFMNPTYTERQGQFLAYIHQYSVVNGRAPAEADMQRFFQITPPSVHSMVLTLEKRGLIQRVPGKARNITLIVSPESLPALKRVQSGDIGGR